MARYQLSEGNGRTAIALEADFQGSDLVVRIFNDCAHIGAVALSEWDEEHKRSSVSLLTRLGHKDDTIAQKAAYILSRSLHIATCVAVGVHIDGITPEEISCFLRNGDLIVEKLISAIRADREPLREKN